MYTSRLISPQYLMLLLVLLLGCNYYITDDSITQLYQEEEAKYEALLHEAINSPNAIHVELIKDLYKDKPYNASVYANRFTTDKNGRKLVDYLIRIDQTKLDYYSFEHIDRILKHEIRHILFHQMTEEQRNKLGLTISEVFAQNE